MALKQQKANQSGGRIFEDLPQAFTPKGGAAVESHVGHSTNLLSWSPCLQNPSLPPSAIFFMLPSLMVFLRFSDPPLPACKPRDIFDLVSCFCWINGFFSFQIQNLDAHNQHIRDTAASYDSNYNTVPNSQQGMKRGGPPAPGGGEMKRGGPAPGMARGGTSTPLHTTSFRFSDPPFESSLPTLFVVLVTNEWS